MPDPRFVQILNLCIDIEKLAVQLYRRLSDGFEKNDIQTFWKRMSMQETQHVTYWNRLLELAERDSVRNVFDHPKQIEEELAGVLRNVQGLLECWPKTMDLKTAFLTAFRVEFYVLHPAFGAMFHLMRNQTQDASPEDDYEKHIRGLAEAMRKWCGADPEMELVAELSGHLWSNNRLLALQLADIQSLRNLIPICMYCKNVRNDRGFWDKVERYLEAHSHMQFSHGICPDCMKKYYPEYTDDKR